MDELLQNLVLLEHLHRNLQQNKQKDLENVSFDEEEISFINDAYKDEEKSIFHQKNKYMYELLKNGYQLQADKNKLIVYVDDVKIVGDKGKVLNFPNTKEERQMLTQNIIKDFCIYESNNQEGIKDKINTNETTQNIDTINKKDESVENKQNEIDDNVGETIENPSNEVIEGQSSKAVENQSSEAVQNEPSATVHDEPNEVVQNQPSATIDNNQSSTTIENQSNKVIDTQSNEANDSSSKIIENQTNEENTEIENNDSEKENNNINTESDNNINSDNYNSEKEIENNQIAHNTNTDIENTTTNDKINEGFYFDLGENEDDDLLNNINFNENLFNGENGNNSENKENHENKEKTEIDNNKKSENKDNKTNSLFNFDNHNDFNFMNNFNEEFMDDNLDIDLTENDLGEIDFGENDLTKNDFNKNDLNENINLEETNLENYDENNLIEEELNKIMNEPDQELFVFNDNKSNDLTNKQKEVYVENENINNNKILNDNDIYNDANDTDTNTDSDIDNINVDFNLEDLKNGNFDFNFSDENNDKSNEEENENENENELNANENNLSDSETNENSEANENQNIDNEYNNSNDEPNENSDLDENKFDDDNFIFNFNEENLENETLFNFGESENSNVYLSSKDDNTNFNLNSNVNDTQNDENSNENSNVNSNDNSIFNENAFDEEKTVLETPIFKEPEKPKLNFITNTIDEDSLTMLEKLKEDKEDYDLSMLETLINEDINNKEEVFNLSLGNFEQKEFDLEKENEKLNFVADEVINNSKNDTLINAKLNDTTISDPINDPINDPIKNTENVNSENEKEIKDDNLTLSGKEENEKLTDYFVSAMQEESDFRREKTKFIKDIVNIEIDFTDGNYHKVDNLRMVIFPLNTASNGTDIATDICAYIEQDDGYIIEYMLPQSKRIIEFHNNDYVIFVKGFWENGQFGSQVRIFSNKGEIKTNIETTKIRPDNNENLGIGHNVIFLDYATTLHLMPIEKQDGTIPVIGVTIKNIGFGESSGDSKLGDPTMIVSGETYKYEVSGYWKDDYFEVNSQIYTPKNMN